MSGTTLKASPIKLMDGYSLEMTAKDVESLKEASQFIPRGTAISITFLPGEALDARVAAARCVRDLGFEPVPHISARRLQSQSELELFLARLVDEAGAKQAFVVAGDPPSPMGPYEDALSVLQSGLLEAAGIQKIGVSGYPEGHPDIPQEKLWRALKNKVAYLAAHGLECEIMTQFAFDHEPVLKWLEAVRTESIHATVRVGLPGPASVKTLLRFAARCGVGASAKVMAKYGTSITKLLNTAGPDKLINAFAENLDERRHGRVLFHFYPFGGLKRTAEWNCSFSEKKAA